MENFKEIPGVITTIIKGNQVTPVYPIDTYLSNAAKLHPDLTNGIGDCVYQESQNSNGCGLLVCVTYPGELDGRMGKPSVIT